MYEAEISRRNPGLFLFLLDQSRSMSHKLSGGERSKAVEATDAINKQIAELINRCTKSEGVRHYFDLGVIGYGFERSGAAGLISDAPVPITEMENVIKKMETRKEKVDDQEVEFQYPVWFEPVAASDTPMVSALKLAKEWVEKWVQDHQYSYPPVVINISDGESTDGSPTDISKELAELSTKDGKTMLWNCHLSESSAQPVSFPEDESKLPQEKYASTMFSISTVLPDSMLAIAREEYQDVTTGARAYVFNARLEDLIKLLDIGTRVAYSRVK